jgi:hypothetical protein
MRERVLRFWGSEVLRFGFCGSKVLEFRCPLSAVRCPLSAER